MGGWLADPTNRFCRAALINPFFKNLKSEQKIVKKNLSRKAPPGIFHTKTRASHPLGFEPIPSSNHSTKHSFVFILDILSTHISWTELKMSVYDSKWIQMEKWLTTKLYNFSRSTTFIFCCFSIWDCLKKLNFKCWKFRCNYPQLDDFKLKSFQLQICITFRDLQLSLFQFLYSRSFENFKFWMWEIQT
jgi:hypothetical protein